MLKNNTAKQKKIKVHWVVKPNDKSVANALGYNVHNMAMYKHCAEYFDYDENASVAITIIPADQFKPVPNKRNILFTMWEAIDVPQSYIPGLRAADLIVVPSEFCREIFQLLTDKKVITCFEGVDTNIFKFKERQFPNFSKGEKFRYLWIGAPNPRKGYYTIMEFSKIVEKLPQVELYIKTTSDKPLIFKNLIKIIFIRLWKMLINDSRFYGHKYTYWQNWLGEWKNIKGSFKRYFNPPPEGQHIIMGKYKNIIFDARKLEFNDLVDLYYSAHCFVIPHAGEGWCLPLCEAMATGCPSVASYSTGVLDFFSKNVGYPVQTDVVKCPMQNYDITARIYVPQTQDFVKQALAVLNDYREAKKRAKKAAYEIKTKFTWEKSAYRLNNIVREFLEKGEANA